jgi:hypothetical protein
MEWIRLYFLFLDRINPSTILQRQINLPELRGRQDYQDFLYPYIAYLKIYHVIFDQDRAVCFFRR